ncbi:MAG: GAF domain-containing sensor histidine kinase [Chloroflexota bacterium]
MTDLFITNKIGQPDQDRVRLEALVSISRRVAERSREEDILQQIVQVACRVLEADSALIVLRESDRRRVRIVAEVGLGEEQSRALKAATFSIDKYTVTEKIYLEGETIVVSDTQFDPTAATTVSVHQLGARAFFATPLWEAGDVIGSLVVHFTETSHDWTSDEIDWLRALADQGALALTLGRTLFSQNRDIAVREALYTASQRLQSAADLETVVTATLEGVGHVVPCIGVTVHLLNEEGTEATLAGLWGYDAWTDVMTAVTGFVYPADDGALNRRSLIEHEAFYLNDFQEEADRWANSSAPTLRAWMSVPLMSHGKCFGKITVDHNLPDVYGPDELAIVQTFAAHAASAIERAHLYTETSSRAEQLAALHLISQELLGASDEAGLYECLKKRVFQTVRADTFFICLGENEYEHLQVKVLIDAGKEYPGEVWEPSPGPTTAVLRTGKAIRLRDRREWEHYGSAQMGDLERISESAIFAPLTWNGQTLGVLSVQTYEKKPYTQDEFQTFQALGATAALALARIRSEATTAARAAQFAALAQSARAIVSNLELSEVLESVVDKANELTGGEAFLMLYNVEDDQITVKTYAGISPWSEAVYGQAKLKPGEGVGGISFAEQRTIVVQDMLLDDRPLYRGESPMRSLVVLPLTVGDSRMGILELAWPEPGAVTLDRLALCTAFADHAALAIHNARQHEELRQRESERTALLRQLLTAQEAERKRVSIELHDGPLQSLGVGLINADTLRRRAEKGAITARDIDALRLDFAAVVDEVRDLMADLRPEVLDSYGLLPALEAHARRINETTQLKITIESDLPERLPAYIEVLVYRLVQESLSNVRKHANATRTRITISLDTMWRILTVRVADDGVGFNPKKLPVRLDGFGLGLSSMAERTESAGGTMHIDSEPGKATTVTFQIPLRDKAKRGEDEDR